MSLTALAPQLSMPRDLPLNDGGRAWVILNGAVDVFLVDLLDGVPAGPLWPVMRVDANEALFGIEANGIGLLARPLPGTNVQAVDAGELTQDYRERWIDHLTAACAATVVPRASVGMGPGEEIAAEEQPVIVRPRDGFLRVRSVGAPAAFVGDANCEINGRFWFPLSARGWVLVPPGARLQTTDSEAGADGLLCFESLVMRRLASRREADSRQATERLRARRQLDGAAIARSLEDLGSPDEPDALTDQAKATADPVFLACRTAGRADGFEVVPSPRLAPERGIEDRIQWIARASGVRSRRVMLRGKWWRETGGPVIAVLEDGKVPVALLPRKSGYEIVNPATGERMPVNARTAGLLEPGAYVLYRPFPRRPLTAAALLEFAFNGSYRDLFAVVLTGLFSGALAMVTPVVTGDVFDSIIPGAQRPQLLAVVLFSMSAAVSAALLSLVGSIALLRMESRMSLSVQAAVWDRLLNLPATFFRQYSSAELAIRSMGINSIRQTLTSTVTSSITTGMFSLFSFGLLFYYDMRLALIATALIAVVIAVTTVASVQTLRIQRIAAAFSARLATVVLQLLNGISKIRVAGAEDRAFALWSKLYARAQRINLRARRINTLAGVFRSVVPTLSSIVIFSAMWHFLKSDANPLTTGHFLAFNAAFGQFFGAALGLSSALQTVVVVVPMYERAKAILETAPEIGSVKADPGEMAGAIDVNQVVFGYAGGKTVLNGLSLSIEPGQFVAIVGASGCGKSTLFRLLLGFEKPASGAVAYDGRDLSTLDLQAVRKQIGTILQTSKLMNGDLYRNIVGAMPLTIDDAWAAARLAGLDADIQKMPMGMHTMVGDGGVGLSGGQRQRLMVARAIVAKPRILLFDEATSALDNRTQAVVARSLEQLSATRVVIAHRLSTVIHADRICFIRDGVIAESGTYEELMQQGGLFAEMAKRQLAGGNRNA